MPETGPFLKQFGIHHGLMVDSWELIDIDINETEIQQYQEYKYDIILLFEHVGNDDINIRNFFSKLKMYVGGNIIIKTRYGNPYECNFGHPKLLEHRGNQIVIESIGTAHRIYH